MPTIIRLPERVSYQDGLSIQDAAQQALLNRTGEEVVYLLEHEPVYTIGRLRDQSSLRDPDSLPHPVFEINRGGQATYHGPGQIVGYPILDLSKRGKDLHAHLRILEEILIQTCAHFGVTATRREGLTGVWIENRKIASLGVGVRRWISMHGFAINITREALPPFQAITPCGLPDVIVTTLEAEAKQPVTIDEAMSIIAESTRRLLIPSNA